ncbi:hypothetical protein C482_06087 [Natrialba chahannaoensis JCM 10990]|uniref:Uncharacterized protein n=1 Tax=Natrialba chahannaoensis JCM 10990 TaxID=1227492 RepID=M0AUI5_9EURY|nr:hypothetical protein [Natrialba chahannaoensis]ELZ01598.1 hypothetical protein C482_06087 [Natrialba chahannaoensis JCM 10990]
MELANRTLRDRVVQALVVGLVLLAFQYYRGTIDIGYILWVSVLVALIVLALDLAKQRVSG